MSDSPLLVIGAPIAERVHRKGQGLTEPGGPALRAALGAFLSGTRPALVGRWPSGSWPALRNALAGRVDLGACPEVDGIPGEHLLRLSDAGVLITDSQGAGPETTTRAEDVEGAAEGARAALLSPLGGITQQLALLRALRARTTLALLAAHLMPGIDARHATDARTLVREADLVFLRLADACVLADGDDVFSWLGANCRWSVADLGGAGFALCGLGRTEILRPSGRPGNFPPGALPAFAGGLLAGLALGRPIEEAAREALRPAAISAEDAGLESLLAATAALEPTASGTRPASVAPAPVRAAVPDYERIERLSHLLSGGAHPAFTFTTPPENFPPVGHPRALEFFFAVVLHQYGFWHLEDGTWAGSLYAEVDGMRLKGSDFVFRAATKAFLAGEDDFTRFLDDAGNCPLPMAETHAELAEGFRRWARRNPPNEVVAEANASGRPVERLMELIADCPGYAEDPYRKKAMLLAMTLANRPERWLKREDGGELTGWGPVVDYHIQRTSLRTGVVLPLDETLRAKLIARTELTAAEEDAVRRATFDAMEELSRLAGISHAAIDYLFFQARRRCPESRDEVIDCPACPLEPACAKQKRLFQPVFRTTAY